jgi:type I restriction enzyme S subunit
MHAEMFLKQFGHLANSDGGVKKLRQLVLQLAVRGKLVAQDAGDEPAAVLLKRIEAERKQLVRAGKIKTPKLTQTMSSTETLFGLPKNWAWTRLGNIGSIFNGDSINASEKEREYTKKIQGYNYIATKDLDFESRKINYNNGIKIPFDNKGFKIAHKGAVLICAEGGSAGKKIAITEEDICFGNKLYAIETLSGLLPRYLFYVYQSPYFYKEFSLTTTGIIGGTSINKFHQISVPLPPLAEQKRIVTKVDELMAVCDALEAAQNTQRTLKQQAVAATLHHLTSPATPADGGAALTILTRQFPEWFDDRITLKTLRATILQLAVQGKLVPQDPSDEPASVLLKKIEAEKKRLVKEGKIKSKTFSKVSSDEKLFDVPSNWQWERLGNFTTFLGGFAYESPMFIKSSNNQVLRLGNVKDHGIVFDTNPVFITDEYAAETDKSRLMEGDVLVTMTGTKAKKDYLFSTTVSSGDLSKRTLYLNQRVGCLRGIISESRFIELLLKSEQLRDVLYAQSTGTANQANIGSTQISNLAVPLPPLAEQKRIVAKVDELMTLCDQLEAQLTTTQTLNTALMDALLHHLCAGVENTLNNKEAA